MYNLSEYVEKDPATVLAFIQQHPFATLIGSDAGGVPVATQVPLLIRQQGNYLSLRGHIMRKTSHHKAFEQNPRVLALFSSPHTYVSPSWYSNPRSGGTWNYMSVQAQGEMEFTNETTLLEILRETQNQFENDPASPSVYENLSPEYVNPLAKAIVGFQIKVTKLDATFKLSQNRDEASYHNIIAQLKKGSADAQFIASEMEKRASQLFKNK
ncbi:FMN-binding negative transcriptional regulator [Pseudoflavitalea rhizosphaerae]|uniref:FMN-binding negative transcriptional regulator n=1 Tax=Pseudoflavitalea rhizosphaerae TaxID=1884793 RepID=UPI000F8CAD42|nr:FMN-binding negative transcriptional regulator [Pseudoflavitalea rhizosphaerae]